jgi:hypothetical protein
MLYAFLCPCIPGFSSIPQSVEDQDDGAVFTNEGEFADQRMKVLSKDPFVSWSGTLKPFGPCD